MPLPEDMVLCCPPLSRTCLLTQIYWRSNSHTYCRVNFNQNIFKTYFHSQCICLDLLWIGFGSLLGLAWICLDPCTATALSLLLAPHNQLCSMRKERSSPPKKFCGNGVIYFGHILGWTLPNYVGSEFYLCGRKMLHLALNWWLLH